MMFARLLLLVLVAALVTPGCINRQHTKERRGAQAQTKARQRPHRRQPRRTKRRKPPTTVVGLYVGRLMGGDRLVLDLGESGHAKIALGNSPAATVAYKHQGRLRATGEILVSVRLGRITFLFARTQAGLELRVPRRPTRPLIGNNRQKTILRRLPSTGAAKPKTVSSTGTSLAAFRCPEGTSLVTKREKKSTLRWCLLKDKKHGPYAGDFDSGQPSLRGSFKHGKREGPATMWNSSGQVIRKVTFVNDELHGEIYVYHPNGKVSLQKSVVHGKAHGKFREWSPSGKLTLEGEYRNGKEHGVWSEATEVGRLTRTWDAGRITSAMVQGVRGNILLPIDVPPEDHVVLARAVGELGSLNRLTEYVIVETVLKHDRRAKGRLNRAGHENMRRKMCSGFAKLRKLFREESPTVADARRLFRGTVQAACASRFSPDRKPKMGPVPVKIGCTAGNVGGRLRYQGKCIEVTPAMCGQVVAKACKR